jgi:hypothetical protein
METLSHPGYSSCSFSASAPFVCIVEQVLCSMSVTHESCAILIFFELYHSLICLQGEKRWISIFRGKARKKDKEKASLRSTKELEALARVDI